MLQPVQRQKTEAAFRHRLRSRIYSGGYAAPSRFCEYPRDVTIGQASSPPAPRRIRHIGTTKRTRDRATGVPKLQSVQQDCSNTLSAIELILHDYSERVG